MREWKWLAAVTGAALLLLLVGCQLEEWRTFGGYGGTGGAGAYAGSAGTAGTAGTGGGVGGEAGAGAVAGTGGTAGQGGSGGTAGSGGAECPPGTVLCGTECADLTSDSAHCGYCFHACPPGKECSNGVCLPICPPAGPGEMWVICGDECVNIYGDADHCLECFYECPPGEYCTSQGCTPSCTPSSETCNGADDDCDGYIDEDFPMLGTQCWEGIGGCEREGVYICDGMGGVTCSATPGTPMLDEYCGDGIDNDCNGLIDDGCPCVEGAQQACGESQGACEQGIQTCTGGVWGPCLGGIGPLPEECEGQVDEDCDGTTDENCDCTNGQTQLCGTDVGLCEYGIQTCIDGKWDASCVGGVTPTLEVCNGADDDCDGATDEITQQCGTSNNPPCSLGVEWCVGGTWDHASCTAIEPTPEVGSKCSDEIDNDCDGPTDCGDADCHVSPDPEVGPIKCNDTKDNDCDGAADYMDPDCQGMGGSGGSAGTGGAGGSGATGGTGGSGATGGAGGSGAAGGAGGSGATGGAGGSGATGGAGGSGATGGAGGFGATGGAGGFGATGGAGGFGATGGAGGSGATGGAGGFGGTGGAGGGFNVWWLYDSGPEKIVFFYWVMDCYKVAVFDDNGILVPGLSSDDNYICQDEPYWIELPLYYTVLVWVQRPGWHQVQAMQLHDPQWSIGDYRGKCAPDFSDAPNLQDMVALNTGLTPIQNQVGYPYIVLEPIEGQMCEYAFVGRFTRTY